MIESFRRHHPFVALKPRTWIERVIFWGGAVLVALTTILFAKLCVLGGHTFKELLAAQPYIPFLLMPFGFGTIVWFTRHFFSGAEDSGIPLSIAAISSPDVADRSSLLSMRITFGKIFFTALSLCMGASVGPEGPSVQIGSSIMYTLGKHFNFTEPQFKRTLVLAGGAAGLAAAFNTPLAGIIFAIEELAHSFESRNSGTVLTAVIIAGIVSIAALGNYTYFGHTSVMLSLAQAWKPVLLCGIVGGLFGGLFSRFLLFFSRGIQGRLGFFIAHRPVVFAAACGLALAGLGLLCDNSIYGTGYSEARSLIEGTQTLPRSFGFMKLLATALSYISGVPGGLFAPALATGAGLGADIAPWLPETPFAAVVILGMVGYFTGVVQVPITATIIVMEMTSDQSLTLPLMATSFLAFAVSRLVCPSSLYHTLAEAFLEKHTRQHEREEPKDEPAV